MEIYFFYKTEKMGYVTAYSPLNNLFYIKEFSIAGINLEEEKIRSVIYKTKIIYSVSKVDYFKYINEFKKKYKLEKIDKKLSNPILFEDKFLKDISKIIKNNFKIYVDKNI